MKKFKNVMALGLATLTFAGLSTQVFANELDTYSIQEEQSTEVYYTLVETSVEGEYVFQPIVNDHIGARSIDTGEQTKTLDAGKETYYIFDNDGLIFNHKKVKVTINKNPGLDLKVTLINRDTGATVDSTYFYGVTGSYTFNLDSGLADYKIYIGNKSDISGQIKFTIKSS